MLEIRQAWVDMEASFPPAVIQTWTAMAVAWEADDHKPNPFKTTVKHKSLQEVKRRLAEIAAEDVEQVQWPLRQPQISPGPMRARGRATRTYPALVTSILHPHLLPDVIAQIGRFEFPPAHLGRLLKTFSAAPQGPLLLVMGPHGEARFVPAEPVPGATALLREVPEILAFVEAWMIFMSVLQNLHLALPVAQGLLAYLNNIVTIAKAYPCVKTWFSSKSGLLGRPARSERQARRRRVIYLSRRITATSRVRAGLGVISVFTQPHLEQWS
ncbi:hypothetical protein B0H14DRAFT_2652740 [Mycena olivaceomarginata]|nr:hypothetical protein B0H14DRAFT_2652740 [Mycena olivaceomarginata]